MRPVKISQLTGRLIGGHLKYKKVKWRGATWRDVSEYVRSRDGKCLQCGTKKHLQADHFHPQCYIWIKQFFNPNKIQTLCKECHQQLPSMTKRKELGYRNFMFL